MDAAPDTDAPPWLGPGVMAGECLRQARWPQAVQAFGRALAAIDTLTGPAREPHAGTRRQLLVGLAEAQIMLDQTAQAHASLLRAYPDLGEPRAEGAPPDIVEAQARMWLGRVQFMQGHPALLQTTLGRALQALPAEQGLGTRAAELKARITELMAVGLGTCGQAEAGLALHLQALAVFEHPAHADLARDRGLALLNAGVDHWQLGQNAHAKACLTRAIAVFQGLVDGGRSQDAVNVNRSLMNLGNVLANEQSFDAAVERLQQAVQGYDALLRRPGVANAHRLRASRAASAMNLGYVLFRRGDWAAASQQYRRARRSFAALALAQPRLRNDEANNWVNEAHLMVSQGRLDAAYRLYQRAWQLLQALADSGHPQLRPEAANARLGLARVQARRGRARAAAQHFSAGLAALVALTAQGQIRYASVWLTAVADHADALLAAPTSRAPAPADGAELLAALALPPTVGVQALEPALQDIGQGLKRLAPWSQRAPGSGPAWLAAFCAAFLGCLLDRAAGMLGESDPDELRRHASGCAALVQDLRVAACRHTQAPQLVAEWFLRTRGLRAQRSALASGQAPALAALREMLARLRRLEEDLLAPGGGGGPVSAARGAAAVAQASQWRELHDACASRRQALVQAGLLPRALRLDAASLAARLPGRAAVLMLARAAPGQLMVVALFQGGDGTPQVLHQVVALDADVAALDGAQLLRQWRQASWAGSQALRRGPDTEPMLAQADTPDAAAGAAQALHRLHEQVASRALRPMLLTLQQRGLDEFALVPSSDLHLLPYHHLLADTLRPPAGRLSVWPSCGALAQHGLRAAAGRRAPVWALAAHGALDSGAPLHWVLLEQALALRLWGPGQVKVINAPAPRQRGVDALLGMGHGWAPAQSPAHAGLLSGKDQVLGAHELSAIRTCRRMVLSCCVLARVDELHSEAMGFLSTSFGYRTSFGLGWLVEVPDAEACLFSLALQYMLHHTLQSALASPGRRQPPWVDVFVCVRQGIAQGTWPAGFGAWLATELPQAVAGSGLAGGPWLNRYEYLRDFDGGLFKRPPPSLQRLMPWVTALGR